MRTSALLLFGLLAALIAAAGQVDSRSAGQELTISELMNRCGATVFQSEEEGEHCPSSPNTNCLACLCNDPPGSGGFRCTDMTMFKICTSEGAQKGETCSNTFGVPCGTLKTCTLCSPSLGCGNCSNTGDCTRQACEGITP